MGLGEAVVDGVELDAPLVGLDDDPNLFETLMTSTRMGPTDGSIRSAPMVLEARTTRWSSPHLTETKASATLRFGYCPTPMTAKSSSSVPWTSPAPWTLK